MIISLQVATDFFLCLCVCEGLTEQEEEEEKEEEEQKEEEEELIECPVSTGYRNLGRAWLCHR